MLLPTAVDEGVCTAAAGDGISGSAAHEGPRQVDTRQAVTATTWRLWKVYASFTAADTMTKGCIVRLFRDRVGL